MDANTAFTMIIERKCLWLLCIFFTQKRSWEHSWMESLRNSSYHHI